MKREIFFNFSLGSYSSTERKQRDKKDAAVRGV